MQPPSPEALGQKDERPGVTSIDADEDGSAELDVVEDLKKKKGMGCLALGCLVLLLLMQWDRVLPNSWLFPADPATGKPREGVCSMVLNKDMSPWRPGFFTDLDMDVSFFFNGTLYANVSDVPEACRALVETDIVNTTTGPACDNFCSVAIGYGIHPYCSYWTMALPAGNAASEIFSACSKVRMWAFLSWLPTWGAYGIVAAYGAISLALVHFYFSKGRRFQWLRSTRTPREDACDESGPYSKGKYAMPLCCFHAKSDMDAARRELQITFASTLIKPATDINAMLSYARTGRPTYLTLMFMSWFFATRCDVFEIVPLGAVATSLLQGYPNWVMYIKQSMSSTQTRLALYINIFAVVRMSGSLKQMFAPMLSIGVALVLSLPSAAVANMLLSKCGPIIQDGVPQRGPNTSTDFYEICALKKKWGIKKYENSCASFQNGVLLSFVLKFQGSAGLIDLWSVLFLISLASLPVGVALSVHKNGGGCRAYFRETFPFFFDDTMNRNVDDAILPLAVRAAIEFVLESLFIAPAMPILAWVYVLWQGPMEFLQLFKDAPMDHVALVQVVFLIGGWLAVAVMFVLRKINPFAELSGDYDTVPGNQRA